MIHVSARSALLAHPRQHENQRSTQRTIAVVLFLGLVVSVTLLSREWSLKKEVTLLDHPQNDGLLKERIKNLTAALEAANRTIKLLQYKLLQCKKEGSGESSDSDNSDDGGKADEGDQARYQQYLLDFKINDEAQRNQWPWLDNNYYYGKLGGANRIQFSEADAAIDAGQAEHYGRDRAFTMGDLDESFNDNQYYGST